MKKLIIVVSIFLILILMGGAIYGINQKNEEVETIVSDQVDVNEDSDQWPDVVLDPMVGFPLH